MTNFPVGLRTEAVLISGVIYWIGVLLQAQRLKRRTGTYPNLKPKGLKEQLLWIGWIFVICGWIGQPLIIREFTRSPFFVVPAFLLADAGEVAGVALLILGYAGTIWCYLILGDSWRIGVNRQERTSLIMTGPYRFVRHPIYVFQIVMLSGATILLPTPFSLLVVVTHLLCVVTKAADEESYLLSVHGLSYRKYALRTGCLLPRLFPLKTHQVGRDQRKAPAEQLASRKIRSDLKNNKKKNKGQALQLVEYITASSLLFLVRLIPFPLMRLLGLVIGRLFYRFVPRRRRIALDNLMQAFPEYNRETAERIAQESFISFILTFLEFAKFRSVFTGPNALDRVQQSSDGAEKLFLKARKIHDEAGGCIFVTPHIGNWEFLPHLSALVGIPLAVVVRPLDNPYLERLFYRSRTETGQAIIPKRNAFFVLQKTLQAGRSIGMLPDQSTMHGIPVEFFGRKANTTPVPALLAMRRKRPIVVVACCRRGVGTYEGFVSDPIMPRESESEKPEIVRLLGAINREMEAIIRKYPGQYLWMHNRWKVYRHDKEFYT